MAERRKRWGKGKLPRGVERHGEGYRAWISVDGCKIKSRTYLYIREAEAVRAEMEKLKAKGIDVFKTLEDAFGLIEKDIELHRKRAGTLRHYRDQIGTLYKTWPKETILRSISKDQVRAFRDRQLATHAPTTVNHLLTLLKRMFNLAIEAEWIDKNPVAGVKMPKLGTRDEIPYSEKEIFDIITMVLEGDQKHARRDAAVIATVAMTGLRAGELARLVPAHISLEMEVIMPDGKRGARHLPLMPELAGMLLPFLEKYSQEHEDDEEEQAEPLFGISSSGVSRIFEVWRHRLGLDKRFHAHNVRKTFATALVRLGADLPTIQKLLGHRDLKTTQLYVSASDDVARRAVARLQMLRQDQPGSASAE